MFSINIERCSSPRPDTSQLSWSACSTLNETSFSSSFISLSSIFLAVKRSPSFPANGLVFTPNVICSVGSSIVSTGSASSFPTSHIVSPTDMSGSPDIPIISPAEAVSISSLFIPVNPNNFCILNCLMLPSSLTHDTICPAFTIPLFIVPIPILPT